jgi:hypothetical protein
MKHSRTRRMAGTRKRALMVSMALVAPLLGLVVASPAMATNPYSVFAQCPTSFPGMANCLYAQTTSGEVKIGTTAVPITKTLTVQGGTLPTAESGVSILLPALNGESLSKTELNVPGGLLDFINCKEIKGEGFFEKGERLACEAIFENKTTGVTATTELVATEHNPAILNTHALFGETGTALTLPVRVHLKNPLFGGECYIGSASSPIQLHLTTGTTSPPKPNEPIHGFVGELGEEGEGGILVVESDSLVDNAFSAPAAEGCGGFFSFLIDPIVDAKIGLPSAAGHNTAILTGNQRISPKAEVLAHGTKP